MDEQWSSPSLAELTAQIVSAYVAHNTVSSGEIGGLIGLVASRLAGLGREPEATGPTKPEPVVSVRRSVGKDAITCLICGKQHKLLKRHLATAHELTPQQYRELFELKSDYPMVAPSYAAARSELALKIGLGRPQRARPSRKPRRARSARATPPSASDGGA